MLKGFLFCKDFATCSKALLPLHSLVSIPNNKEEGVAGLTQTQSPWCPTFGAPGYIQLPGALGLSCFGRECAERHWYPGLPRCTILFNMSPFMSPGPHLSFHTNRFYLTGNY